MAILASYWLDVHALKLPTSLVRNGGQASDLAIEASAIGTVILGFIDEHKHWKGTAQELLTQLEDHHDCSERTKNRRETKGATILGKGLSEHLDRTYSQ